MEFPNYQSVYLGQKNRRFNPEYNRKKVKFEVDSLSGDIQQIQKTWDGKVIDCRNSNQRINKAKVLREFDKAVENHCYGHLITETSYGKKLDICIQSGDLISLHKEP